MMSSFLTWQSDEGLALHASCQQAVEQRGGALLLVPGEQRHQLGQRGPSTQVLHTQHLQRNRALSLCTGRGGHVTHTLKAWYGFPFICIYLYYTLNKTAFLLVLHFWLDANCHSTCTLCNDNEVEANLIFYRTYFNRKALSLLGLGYRKNRQK